MRINQLKIGAVLSYATQGIHILTGLIYTPVMLRLLGQSEYGLYQLVNSVVSYLSLLSLGFSAAYVRFYSRYKVENNDEGIAKINGMFLSFFTIISVICLLCGGVMVANIDMVLGSGLTTKEQATARVLMFLMVINMALSFMT
ncbi:MAG: oligosaccharide flippase family protein, partial [Clostridia bacterium]|nr:oligosaccharide flippase family protein [Clostridia bacterium]